MMSLMVPPVAPAGQLADALALLRVASDPEPARARLEQIAAAQTRLAEADAQLTAKMADLDGREKTVAAREVEVVVIKTTMADLNDRERRISELAAQRDQGLAGRKLNLTEREQAVQGAIRTLEKREAKVADREAKLAADQAKMDALRALVGAAGA